VTSTHGLTPSPPLKKLGSKIQNQIIKANNINQKAHDWVALKNPVGKATEWLYPKPSLLAKH
jgi:hypothetical protein